jgi:hypothetical protein
MTKTADTFRMGSILGRIELPESVFAAAREQADSFYAGAEAAEFCGYDEPETLVRPAWLPPLTEWMPTAELAELGYRVAAKQVSNQLLVLSVGVEPHDDGWGPVLMLCLANDGLTFRQRGVRNKAVVGEWFIFDDLVDHELLNTKKTTTFIGFNVPLERI